MASVNVEITGDARKLEQTFDDINRRQQKVEDGFDDVAKSGQDAARKIDSSFSKTGETGVDAARKIDAGFSKTGETGKEAARKTDEGFSKAGDTGKDAARKIDDGLAKAGETGKESARQVEAANEAAANKGAASYNRILAELRKQGPEGRAQARAIEQYLRDAGLAGRRSIELIHEELEEIDPTAARVAQKSETAFDKFSASAVAKIGAIAAAYVSVEKVVSSIDGYLQKQEQRIKDSAEAQKGLAVSQQDSLKAFAAYTTEERDYLLNVATRAIMEEAEVGDESAITTALGLASEGTPEQAIAAVTAAAKANQLSPENIAPVAAAAVSVMLKTGIEDPRAAIALMQTTDSQSAIEEAQNLISNLPVAMTSVSTAREQDPVEAARQIGAIWAAGTVGGGDRTGAATSTFTVDLASRLGSFFGDIESQRIDAQSRLEALNKTILTGERQQASDTAARDQLRGFLDATTGDFDPSRVSLDPAQAEAYQQHQRQRIRSQELIERVNQREAYGEATELDLFDRQAAQAFLADTSSFWDAQRAAAEQKLAQVEQRLETSSSLEKERRDRDQLTALLQELQTASDPQTVFGRIQALQSNPAMRSAFVGSGFGNKNFDVFLRELLTEGSQTDEAVRDAFGVVQADPDHYVRQVHDQGTATPALRNATATANVAAQTQASTVFDNERATLGSIRDITTGVLASTNRGGMAGYFDDWYDNFRIPGIADFGIARGGLGGSTAAEEGISAIEYLQGRQSLLANPEDQAQIAKAIEEITGLIIGQASTFSVESLESAHSLATSKAASMRGAPAETTAQRERMAAGASTLERIAALLEQQIAIQQKTADNTRPRPRDVNPGDVIRAGAAQSDARAPR